MQKGIFLLSFMAMFMGQAYAAVGVATAVSGQVDLQRSDQVFALVEGVNINIGDVVRTGVDASAQLDMDDGSVLSLGANSEITITDYSLREDGSIADAAIEMFSGWLRFAVSKLRSRDSRYRFHMPTAVLGVRGTEGVIQVEGDEGAEAARILLEEGVVEVAEEDREGQLSGHRLTLKRGQFAERLRGKRLGRRFLAMEAFKKRMPAHLRLKLKRRIRMLKRRGITPRKIRKATRHEIRGHLRHYEIKRRTRKLHEIDKKKRENIKAKKKLYKKREKLRREHRRKRD